MASGSRAKPGESLGNDPMPTYRLDIDFPMLWAASKDVNDADRRGQSVAVGPLHREMEAAMFELWNARRSQA